MKKIKFKLFIFLLLIGTSIFGYNSIQEDNSVDIIPIQYKDQLNDAISCFPKGTFDKIRINYIKMNSDNMTWATRPSITSFLRPRKKRTYLIQESTHKDMRSIFEGLSYNAQVGIFVHELCHILAYEKMSKTDIISFGYNYQFDEIFKKSVEQETDQRAKENSFTYWNAWKSTECITKENEKSLIEKKYWKKQHKYYLTIQCNE